MLNNFLHSTLHEVNNTIFSLFISFKCFHNNRKKTKTHNNNTFKLFFYFSYYVFINKKQKQLEEHHISYTTPKFQLKSCHASAFMLLQLLFIQSPTMRHPQTTKLRLHAHTNFFALLLIFHSCIDSFTIPNDLRAH